MKSEKEARLKAETDLAAAKRKAAGAEAAVKSESEARLKAESELAVAMGKAADAEAARKTEEEARIKTESEVQSAKQVAKEEASSRSLWMLVAIAAIVLLVVGVGAAFVLRGRQPTA